MNRQIVGGKYRLLNIISRGGMGEIWEAERIDGGEKVALKRILEKTRRRSVDNLLRFKKEAEILSNLKHENVVRVFDFIESEDDYYIAMELLRGESLGGRLARGPLSVEEFLEISIPLAETLAFIHKNGIIHGDIKPSNVMLVSGDGLRGIKLLDFGMSHLLNLHVPGPQAMGTFAYMSPEQSGILRRPVEIRSDLYSLGIVFYQCLAGELPYSAPSVYALIHKHIAVEAAPLHEVRQDIPPILGEIVRKLMNKDVSLRYETADLLARDLRTVQQGLAGEKGVLQFVPGFSLKPRIEKGVLRLVGRDEEFRRLCQYCDKAVSGEGRIVILSGESGIGKTRLMEELQEYVIIENGLSLQAGFGEYETPLPYSGFFKALARFFTIMEMYSREKRDRIRALFKDSVGSFGRLIVPHLPQLGDFLSLPPLASQAASRGEDQRLLEKAILNILFSLSGEFPVLLLCIDNLQWSDQATRGLVKKLAEGGKSGNILIVCTLRHSASGGIAAVFEALGGLTLNDNISLIALQPFTRDDVSRLIAQFIGREDPVFRPLGDILFRKTGGNVYFIIEFLQLLVRDKLIRPNEKWHIDYPAIEKLPFSENVASIVSKSIGNLDEETMKILSLAAVWGREFTISDVLGCFPALSGSSVFAAVEKAANMNLLIQAPDVVRFSHDICYDIFLNSIPVEKRRGVHERIAEYLEQKMGEDPRVAFRIVFHYRETSRRDKSLEYLRKAGLLSQQGASFRDALGFFLEAAAIIKALPSASDAEQEWIHLHLGETYASIGLYEESRRHLEQALILAPQDEEKADILRRMSDTLQSEGNSGGAISKLVQALALLGDRLPKRGTQLGMGTMKQLAVQVAHSYRKSKYVNPRVAESDSPLLKKQSIYQELGLVCLWIMRQDLLIYSHFKALNLCDIAGVSEDGVILLLTHCAVLGSLDLPARFVRRLYKRIDTLLQRIDENLGLLGRPFLGQALFLAVKYSVHFAPESLESARQALALLDRNGTVNLLQEVSNCAAQIFEYFGRFQELDAMAHDVIAKGAMLHNEHMTAVGRLYQGIAAYYLGDAKKSLEILRPVLSELVQSKDGANAQFARQFVFKALCRLDRLRDAVPLAEDAMGIIRAQRQAHQMDISRIYPFYLEELILAYSSRRDIFLLSPRIRQKIDWLYSKCAKLVRAYDCLRGPFFRLCFLYAWHMKRDRNRARKWYEKGAEYFKSSDQPYEHGLLHFQYAKCLLADDPRSAAHLLEKAFLELDKCGALFEMRQIERLLKSLAGEPRAAEGIGRTEETPSDLTPGTPSDTFSAVRELDNLLDITRKISVVKDTGELEEEILRHSMELVGAEQGELFLYEDGHLASVRKIVAEGVKDYPSCPGIVSSVESTGKPLLVPDAAKDPIFMNDPIVLKYSLRSVLCVPLNRMEKKIGLLYLSNQKVEGVFTAHELEILVAMAGQAAVAIENTALFTQTKTLQTYLDEILNSMPGVVIAMDARANITHFNSAASRNFPAVTEKSIGCSVWQMCPVLARYRGDFETVLFKGGTVEYPRESFDGKLWRVSLFPVGGGASAGAVLKLNDVTEEAKLQEHLFQAQKMDAIGTLVGGLTHDFNNILWGIRATIGNLLETVLPSKNSYTRGDLEEDFKTIELAVTRAINLVSQLRTVRQRKQADAVPVDLRASVDNILKVCRKSFDKRISFDARLPEEPAMILADPVQMEQVVLNLAINASHAMTIMRKTNEKWGGLLTFAVEKTALVEEEVRHFPGLASGDYWRLDVRDTGVGMNEQTLNKIYEPFFTTKEAGQGTGLGLSVVYTIVQNFKGRIDVESATGSGTVFSLFFPAIAQTPASAEAKTEREREGKDLVLVIDDEEAIRNVFVRFLAAAGWETLQARDGSEGVESYGRFNDRIALVILDMVMPQLWGKPTIEALRRINPDVRILLTSEFLTDRRIDELLGMGVRAFLPKPFTEKELMDAVAKSLE